MIRSAQETSTISSHLNQSINQLDHSRHFDHQAHLGFHHHHHHQLEASLPSTGQRLSSASAIVTTKTDQRLEQRQQQEEEYFSTFKLTATSDSSGTVMNPSNLHHQAHQQQQQQQAAHQHNHQSGGGLYAAAAVATSIQSGNHLLHLNPSSQGSSQNLETDYDDDMENNIDENTTVPHPSVHQTTTTSATLYNPSHQQHQLQHQRGGGDMNHHQQQQHLYNQDPLAQFQHHVHHNPQQQHQPQQPFDQQFEPQNYHHDPYGYAPSSLSGATGPSEAHLNLSQQSSNQLHHLHPNHHHHHHHQQHQQHNQQQSQAQVLANHTTQQHYQEIMSCLDLLLQDLQRTDILVMDSREAYESFVIQVPFRSKLVDKINHYENMLNPSPAHLNHLEEMKRELKAFEINLKTKATELNESRMRVLHEQTRIFDKLQFVQQKVLYEYLPKWHREQQYSNNGVKADSIHLDLIQTWVEKLVDITWRLKNQIKGLRLTVTEKPNIKFDFARLERFSMFINKSLEDLILNTFVVEKQPPQVMKTNTRFTSTVRFLPGARLNVQMINPTVKAIILSESNARAIIQKHKQVIDNSWNYLENQMRLNELQDPNQSQNSSGLMSPLPGGILSASNSPGPHLPTLQQQPPPPQQQSQNFFQQGAGYLMDSQQQQQQLMSLTQIIAGQATNQLAAHQQQPMTAQTILAQPNANQSMTHQQQKQFMDRMSAMCPPDKSVNINEFDPSGEILNNSNILEYQEASQQLLCHFRNMQLKKIKRTEKKGTESVMDEKFVLLFYTEFRIADSGLNSPAQGLGHGGHHGGSGGKQSFGGGDLFFQLMAFSLPVVVIVHGNQEPHAWATVTWHNAFAEPDELLYRVPDKVTWRQLGGVLSEKFRSCAGKGLNRQNLEYLASKVNRSNVQTDDTLVNWNQFAKEPLSDRSFTFWEWFHSILKLTKDHLRDLWQANRIYGFVGKKGCIDLLLGSSANEPAPIGTFLLRYSETELGGITICWKSCSSPINCKSDSPAASNNRLSPGNYGSNASNALQHLQPFGSKDLQTRSLADRIRDLKDLVYLFPDLPKDDAFKNFYTPLVDTPIPANGYIRPILIQTLPSNYSKDTASVCGGSNVPSQANSMDCTTATPSPPNSYSQSSPDAGGIYHDNANLTNNMESNNYNSGRPSIFSSSGATSGSGGGGGGGGGGPGSVPAPADGFGSGGL